MYKSIMIAGSVAMIALACGSENEGSAAAVAAPSALKVAFLDGGAHLTWKDNSDDESEFMIERREGNADWDILDSVPFDTTQYHDADLGAGKKYTYRVMAMPKNGGHDEGAYSNEAESDAPATLDDAAKSGGAGAPADHSGHGAAGS